MTRGKYSSVLQSIKVILLSEMLFCILGMNANSQEQRVALVIGNGQYQNHVVLINPPNDASDIAAALQKDDFTVTLLTDASRKDMEQAVRSFGNSLKNPEAVGLFYYSGHGAQAEGVNYLIPVDADIQDADELAYNAVDVESILAKMRSAGNKFNIVVLDACRDNPFPGASRSAEKGLAVVKIKVPESMIVYATDPGSTASDGEGRNSPFTKAFLENMNTPNQDITKMMKRVSSQVQIDTDGKQTPWVTTNLTKDFTFNPSPSAKNDASIQPGATQPTVVSKDSLQDLDSLPKTAIKIDGDFADWKNIIPAFAIGIGSPGKDNFAIDKAYLAVDENNLYMRFDIKDITSSSFFHPHNFDMEHNSFYRITLINGASSIILSVSYNYLGVGKGDWQTGIYKMIDGRWELEDQTGEYAMKGPHLEASFPLETIKKNLGVLSPGAYYKIYAWTGYEDSDGNSTKQEDWTATKRFTFSLTEVLYGTWINEKMSFSKIILNPDGTFENYKHPSDINPFRSGKQEIVNKWTDSKDDVYYETFDNLPYGIIMHSLWKVSESGTVVEMVGRASVVDPKYFPKEIDPKDPNYFIFYRSQPLTRSLVPHGGANGIYGGHRLAKVRR
jgi:hypothetical protein